MTDPKVLHIEPDGQTHYDRIWWNLDFENDRERDLKEWVKKLPGIARTSAWDGDAWRIPASWTPVIRKQFEREGFDIDEMPRATVHVESLRRFLVRPETPYKEDQLAGIAHALNAPGQQAVIPWVTGAGKTAAALAVARFTRAKKILVVCPGNVRYTWLRSREQWAPDLPWAAIIKYGRKRKLSKPKTKERDEAYQAAFQIVNYDLVHEVTKPGWDLIVFDESHFLQNPAARWTRECKAIVKLNPHSSRLALSATFAPTEPLQIYGPLDTMQPDCWGKLDRGTAKNPPKRSFEFLRRYAEGERGEYGWLFNGFNEARLPELKMRLDTLVCPPVTVPSGVQYLVMPIDVEARATKRNCKTQYERLGWAKMKAVLEEIWTHSASHTVVWTWHRALAEEYAKVTQGTFIHGNMSYDARDKEVQRWTAEGGVLAITMAAAGIGIDLGAAREVYFAETNPRYERMVQAAGRHEGYRTVDHCNIRFMPAADHYEEQVLWKLRERLLQIQEILGSNEKTKVLTELFDADSFEESLLDIKVTDDKFQRLDFEEE